MKNDTHLKFVQLQRLLPEISNQIRMQARVIEDNFKIVRNFLVATDANLEHVAKDVRDGKDNMQSLTGEYREMCSRLENWRNSFVNAITSGVNAITSCVNAGTNEFVNVFNNQPSIAAPHQRHQL